MGKRTSYPPGTFCWVDLSTTNPAAAKAFYGDLFGWQAVDMPVGDDQTYTMLRLDGDDVAGLSALPPDQREQGIPPYWFNHVSVEDAAAIAARSRDLGGTVVVDAFDVLDAGRMAIIRDPVGAVFGAWQPANHIGASVVNDPGSFAWNELDAHDPAPAIPFYRDLFGWEIDPQEEDGKVRYYSITNGGRANGGMMPLPESVGPVPPHWLPYFTVASTDDAVVKIGELGGQVLAGPMDVGSGRIAVAQDPQGAAFAVFQGEVDE